MQTKEIRTMSNRDLDRLKPQLNGNHGDDGDDDMFDSSAKPVEDLERIAIGVPFDVPFDGGNVRCQMLLHPELGKKMETLQKALTGLKKLGYNINVYRQKSETGGFR